MIEIQVWLYGKPSWEMPIEGINSIAPNVLRKRAKELSDHLLSVADLLEKLNNQGWKVSGDIYTLTFFKDKEVTKEEIIAILRDIPINKENIEVIDNND